MTESPKKKLSALELSQAPRSGATGLQKLLDPSTLLFVIGIGLLIAGVFCAWQSWMMFRELSGASQIERFGQWEVQAIGKFASETRARISTAVNSADVTAALQQGNPDAAKQALKVGLPTLVDADFYKPDLSDVLSGDFATFGYAKASMLVRAHELNLGAPLQSHLKSNKQRVLAFALPAFRDKQAIAFAYVELPFEPLLEVFRQPSVSNARIDLRQGDGRGDLILDSIGDTGTSSSLNDIGAPVAASVFRIGSMPAEFPIFLPDNLWVALPLAIVLIVVGGFFLYARNIGWSAAIGRLTRAKAPQAESDTTLAQAIAQTPKPTVAQIALKTKPAAIAAPVEVDVDASIFRAYDIRGVLGKTLTPGVARQIGRAIGSEARRRELHEIVVGRDGRLSGPELSAALIEGLRSTGCNVIDIGAVPTPVLYFATYHLNAGSGISVTGSHNPPDYNGFKIVLGGETLAESAITDLYNRIRENRFVEGSGTLQKMDVAHDYVDRITGDVSVEHKLKVVVDCGNGIPGAIVPSVLEGIGCEVLPLYCDVDGTFPNHHPDPSDLANLQDLILSVKQMNADIGLAFDGDGDRLGVVTATGEVIFPDRLLMLFARDVLTRNPGATIIYDVKCTGKLQSLILQAGGSPIMWKTGHSLIKAKMRETDAALAGEMSGHFFFRERWFGFDDGIYAAARLCEILAADPDGRTPQEIFDTLPKGVSTPELKIQMTEGAHYAFIEKFQKAAAFDGARVTTIDGVRADWSDGWGLVRASNTTPVLVLRFDAETDAALLRIKEAFRAQIAAVDSTLTLPF